MIGGCPGDCHVCNTGVKHGGDWFPILCISQRIEPLVDILPLLVQQETKCSYIHVGCGSVSSMVVQQHSFVSWRCHANKSDQRRKRVLGRLGRNALQDFKHCLGVYVLGTCDEIVLEDELGELCRNICLSNGFDQLLAASQTGDFLL